MSVLRCYQQSAFDNVLQAFSDGIRSTMIVLATGTGKTIVAGHVAKEMMQRGRVMVLVHRTELLNQARDKFREILGVEPSIEKADQFSDEDSMHGKPPLVIASVPTLNSGDNDMRRLHRFDPSEFAFVWGDEIHHGVSDSWKRCIDHFRSNPDLCFMGCTATPDRLDKKGLIEIIDHVSARYELDQAIRDGYLVPIHQRRVSIKGLEFAKIRTIGGDFDQGELEAAMLVEKPLHGVAHATIEVACGFEIGYLETIRDDAYRSERIAQRLAGKPPLKTLVFTVSVSHAERLAEIFNRWIPDSAKVVSAKTPTIEREQMKKDYADGKFTFLCNCGIWLEGADEPGICLVSQARPTKSRTLYAQCIGRATRPPKSIADELGKLKEASERIQLIRSSEKNHCIILDFNGNSGRHKLICTADILGTAQTQDVIDRASEIAEENEVDMTEALAQAADEEELSKQDRAAEEMHEADAADQSDQDRVSAEAMRRLNVVATVKYDLKQVSGFDQSERRPESNDPNLASPAQVAFLVKLGCQADTAAGYSRKQAGAVITSLKEKRCTNGQRWKLKTLGFSEGEISSMNVDRAAKEIDEAMRVKV